MFQNDFVSPEKYCKDVGDLQQENAKLKAELFIAIETTDRNTYKTLSIALQQDLSERDERIRQLEDELAEAKQRETRLRELLKRARSAITHGGESYASYTLLRQDIWLALEETGT